MSAVLLLALAAVPAREAFLKAEAERSPAITVPELRAHVYRLASPEYQGRRGAGAARTSHHLAEAFQRLGLWPAFGESYFQEIPWLLADEDRRKDSFIGRNVAAVLPGSDPSLRDEWLLLSAHYDHLGGNGATYFPGADDNASGVAMLLEVAERLALSPEKPRRTIVFVAFDQEESGLLGSTHFATHSPREFRKLKAFLTADMIGRSMANLMDEYVFALGSESSPQLRQLLGKVPPPDGLKVGRIGADLIGTRSDYGPFRDRRVPFLFFSTGQHPDYHRVTDLPGRIDYAKLARISRWIHDLTRHLADADQSPVWSDKGLVLDLEEVRTVLVLVTRVLERPNSYPLKQAQRDTVQAAQRRLRQIMERGRVTASERTWLVWTARLLLVTVF